jgi:hypothetical protein
MEMEPASETLCFYKKLEVGQCAKKKKKIVLFNFHPILFSLLDFLTLEAGTDRLSQNVGVELPLCTA